MRQGRYRHRTGAGSERADHYEDTVIAKLKPGFWPGVPVRTLFGVTDDGAWGLMTVSTTGDVTLIHRYGPKSHTWGYVDTSVTYAIA